MQYHRTRKKNVEDRSEWLFQETKIGQINLLLNTSSQIVQHHHNTVKHNFKGTIAFWEMESRYKMVIQLMERRELYSSTWDFIQFCIINCNTLCAVTRFIYVHPRMMISIKVNWRR
jgi:hypothetical protein